MSEMRDIYRIRLDTIQQDETFGIEDEIARNTIDEKVEEAMDAVKASVAETKTYLDIT